MFTSRATRMVVMCVVFLLAISARAQLNRSAVSVSGLDTNTCAPASPCRSFAVAISKTNAGGDMIALDSGGFGAFAADRSVVVESAPGAYAGVTVTSGNAILISTPSVRVVLRGLTINGLGTAAAGIAFTDGSVTYVEGCSITGFVNYGIVAFHTLRVSDTTIRDCGSGIWIDNAGAAISATVERTTIRRMSGGDPNSPGTGILAFRNTQVTVRDTLVSDAERAFSSLFGLMNLENCTAAFSSIGIEASNGIARISNCVVTGNTTGLQIDIAGTIESWQNNKVSGNTSNLNGSLTNLGMN